MKKIGIAFLAFLTPLATTLLGLFSYRRKLIATVLGLMPLLAGNYLLNQQLGLSTQACLLLSIPAILTFWIGLRLNVVGLTGGIATGKSSVSRMLQAKGFHIVDADKISHDLRTNDEGYQKALVAAFGPQVWNEESKQIDSKVLGEIVFANPAKRKQLN